jgi:hypothetical protein
MKKARSLKEFKWDVVTIQRSVGYPNFYWRATSDRFIIETQSVYNSEKHSKDSWREFANSEGIKNFTII